MFQRTYSLYYLNIINYLYLNYVKNSNINEMLNINRILSRGIYIYVYIYIYIYAIGKSGAWLNVIRIKIHISVTENIMYKNQILLYILNDKVYIKF